MSNHSYYRHDGENEQVERLFERSRIQTLQEERLSMQKKAFTKWINAVLLSHKTDMKIDDLYTDLADGKKLLKLFEIISGKDLAKPNNGKMRVHKIENVNKGLVFLREKVHLESIGAEDIVDGNPRLILGLIWTIIRTMFQEIKIDVSNKTENSKIRSAEDALLVWCQHKTSGYPNVSINDFTNSWKNGLGFNALIHSHRPDLFSWDHLRPGKNIDNLNHAFDVAYNEFGIPKLLDAEDIHTKGIDEKSIITYLISYYRTFTQVENETTNEKTNVNQINEYYKQMSMPSFGYFVIIIVILIIKMFYF